MAARLLADSLQDALEGSKGVGKRSRPQSARQVREMGVFANHPLFGGHSTVSTGFSRQRSTLISLKTLKQDDFPGNPAPVGFGRARSREKLADYRRKRDPASSEPLAHPAHSRLRPAPRRPPAPLRLRLSATGRLRAGRSRRAFRSSPASVRSPSTSRITHSTTPTSRGRSRPASTAPAPWRSGTVAPTSSSRRRRTAG